MFVVMSMTENAKYREAHYPDLHPCADGCRYWRPIFSGNYPGRSSHACHYCIDHGELRGEEPDLIRGECRFYENGKGSGKRTNPMLKIRKRG